MGSDHSPSNAQLWHRDRDDLSELKLFFYGTDVTYESGPHAYIPFTHTFAGLKSIFSQEQLDNPIINGFNNKFIDDDFFTSLLPDFPQKFGLVKLVLVF